MPVHFATLYGACLGLLAGIAIILLFNLEVADAIYRTAILSVSGAWMGLLLALLNSLLQSRQEEVAQHNGKHSL